MDISENPSIANKPIIIALCGFEGSGKDSAGKILSSSGVNYGFISESFAYSLKQVVAHIFGWDFRMLEGLTDESRKWREEVDEFWSAELKIPELTPRKVLQLIGTDVMRKHFSDKIWVLSLKKRILISKTNIIITDCRFPSEATEIKRWGGMVIRIERESAKPSWYEDFFNFAKTIDRNMFLSNEDYCMACAEGYYKETKIHPAETSLLLYDKFDYIIENNGTLEEFGNNIHKLLIRKDPKKYVRNIAIDMDDCIIPFWSSFIKFCNRTRGYNLTIEDCTSLSISQLLKCNESTSREIFSQFIESKEDEEMHSIIPSKECLDVLTRLSQHYGLYVVTAREHKLERITKEYISRHFPGIFKDICLANYYGEGCKYTKEQLCIENNCQILLDDSIINVNALKNSKVQGILFGYYPWNRNDSDNIRLSTWEEVAKYFKV